jgi:hypothetical protein
MWQCCGNVLYVFSFRNPPFSREVLTLCIMISLFVGFCRNMTLLNSEGLLYCLHVFVVTSFSELLSAAVTKEFSYCCYCYWFRYFQGHVTSASASSQDVTGIIN